jgi:hypothetical protein
MAYLLLCRVPDCAILVTLELNLDPLPLPLPAIVERERPRPDVLVDPVGLDAVSDGRLAVFGEDLGVFGLVDVRGAFEGGDGAGEMGRNLVVGVHLEEGQSEGDKQALGKEGAGRAEGDENKRGSGT